MQRKLFDSLFLGEATDESSDEVVHLITTEEESDFDLSTIPGELPILPIRNTVLYPGVVIPITVGRSKSIKLVKKAYKGDRIIGVAAQKNEKAEDPGYNDIFHVGTVARIIKMLVLPDGNTTIIIHGLSRFQLDKVVAEEPFLRADITLLPENFPSLEEKETQALFDSLKDAANRVMQLNPDIPQEARIAIDNIESPGFLTHFLSSNINAEVKEKQRLLETHDGKARATLLLEFLMKEIQMLEIKMEIHNKVNSDIDQQQRDYFLRQQIKVLQDELGQDGPDKDIEDLRLRGAEKNWPDEVYHHFLKELDKIARMNPGAADYPVAINYAELLVDLPWEHYSEDNFDLKRAQRILDKDHYGMEKVKERILEYLAVLKLKNNLKGPILCLYGPPGVGKTSLGKSIARALGREYVRMSLGGVHDEAEIRGHRKTYIGAMPGKILGNIKKAGTSNPVFVLDEVDKISSDFRGDPASALLELLDPEQNDSFVDNYVEVEYDLSKVLFVATANSLDTIHPALRDRMEIIEITGYTREEKIEIAKQHLIPKQKELHGLAKGDLKFNKKGIEKIIEGYTRESGVRNLERQVGSVIRRIAKSIAMEEEYVKTIGPEQVVEILGTERFDNEEYMDSETAGVVTGLAWTQVGGEILFIESSLSRGKGKLTLSGQLGDVMKESAVAALSYLRSNADHLGIDHRIFEHYDLHLHVPAGAVPKDGPSAGITMLTSLASIFTQRKVREKLAMTGEITLRGKVLPVGGIKEKILAARRAGIKEVILCHKNKKDVDDIKPEAIIKDMTFHYVEHADEVINIALLDRFVKRRMSFVIPEKEESERFITL